MRLLVIEDEAGIARFLKEGLEEECFAVDVAVDGKTGLDLAMTNEYDLIMVDWMIPAISGARESSRRARTRCRRALRNRGCGGSWRANAIP